MAGRDEPRWVRYWRQRRDSGTLIGALTKREATRVLNSLVAYPRIAHQLEWLLADLADIPYDMHRLKERLGASANLLVRTARDWFDRRPELFSYHGGKLIEVVFPQLSPALETELRAYVGTADVNDTKFVLEMLRAYSGEAFLQPPCKDIVASLSAYDPLLTSVEIALEP